MGKTEMTINFMEFLEYLSVYNAAFLRFVQKGNFLTSYSVVL